MKTCVCVCVFVFFVGYRLYVFSVHDVPGEVFMCHVSVSFQCCPGEIQLDELRYLHGSHPVVLYHVDSTILREFHSLKLTARP